MRSPVRAHPRGFFLLGARLKEDTYDLVDPELVAVLLNLPQLEFSEDTLIEARKRPWLESLPAPFPATGEPLHSGSSWLPRHPRHHRRS